MASKFGLAGGIPERRVRPIWDAVDSRQYKAALKLAASLLQKFPKSPYALALKALILERMGKSDEALNVCLNAKELLESDTAPFLDDLTLSTLQIVFQRLDRLDLGTSCYEQACTKYLNNLEIMMGLFNCHVREYSYVKQQQTAIKMYKAVGEERFLLWAVSSIQLQVLFTSGGEKLLPLGEALIKKHITSHSLHEPEALTIYISILEQQGKYDSALEVISGDLGTLIGRDEDKLRLQGRLLSRSCNYSAASEIFQKVLESCPDDWELFHHYLACLLEENIDWSKETSSSVNKESKLTEEMFNSRLTSALSLVEKLQKDATESCTRGPYLAQIEIQKRLRLNGNSNNGSFMDALLNYFNRFGHLSNCASDVESYLHLLEENERILLLERIYELEMSSNSQIGSLGQAITIFKVQEICGFMWKKSIQELEIGVSKKVELFCKNLHLSKDLDPQENMHGEELLVMACNTLVLLFWRTKDLRYLLEAVLVLEFGLTIRRYTWQYKIPLVHIYSHLNALPLACDWYRTLDVKNVLLETLSHHILPQTLISPLLNDASEFSKDYLKFIDDHLKESADLTCLAYRHRNYSKAIEFVRFKERLQHSSQYLMTKLDSCILDIKSKANNLDEVEKLLENMNYGMKPLELIEANKLECLTTNGDLQSRPWWSPSPTINYLSMPFDEESAIACFASKLGEKTENETPEIPSFERKALVPRLVRLSMQAASLNHSQNAESANGAILNINIVGELGTLLEKYARTIGFSFNDAIHAILSISNGQKSFKDFPSDVVSCISFAVFINAWNCSLPNISDKEAVHKAINWEIVDRLVKLSIQEKFRNLNPGLTFPGNEMPVLAQLITEPFTWHILVIQSYLKSVIPLGKKKKKNEKLNVNVLPQLKIVQSSINCLIDSIGEINVWIKDQIDKSEGNDLDILMGYLGKSNEGGILNVLKENLEKIEKCEVGERIFGLIKSWNYGEVMRRLVGAQRKLLKEFGLICESKLKLLESLKQNI